MPTFARLSPAELRLALSAPRPALGWVSEWTTVSGVPTHHRRRVRPAPQGPPVVLVHGLAVSHRYLMPTAHAVARRHPVLVPDLPGFGLSGKPTFAYDVRRHAEHLARWLDQLGLPPVCLLGHSFGAEVAAALARHRPDTVAAVVLAGPTADAAARSRRGQIRRWCTDLLAEDPRQAAILARDVADARPWRVFATLTHSVRNAIEQDVRRLTVPTLVLRGARDPVVPPGWLHQTAQWAPTGALTAVVPGAGHNAVTTAGRQVAAAVMGFLTERVAGGAARVPVIHAHR